MIAKADAEKLISDRLDEVRLKKIIRNTSIVAWKQEITDDQVENWLQNFKGAYFDHVENERKLALWLLSHFSYFTYDDIRILCRNILNQYLHVQLLNCKQSDIKAAVTEIMENTLFIGLGNESESGNNILYYFRQENHLSKDHFELHTDKGYKNLVYVDDVTISGEQAITYIQSRNIVAENIYAALLIATEDAIQKLSDPSMHIHPVTTMILDERDRTFSESSYVFSDARIAAIKPFAEEFCQIYGQQAVQGYGYMQYHPLGYQNGQYMIGFEYNTPDNTLPLFWGTGNGWKPLFKRYQKITNRGVYLADDRKYY